MYQPARRAKKRGLSAYERRQTEQALKNETRNKIIPNQYGSRAQKEAWMRQRQALRTAKINGQREAELVSMAYKEIRQRERKSTLKTESPK
jgi:hypothetical protein